MYLLTLSMFDLYDIQKNYDTRVPASTFYVRSDIDVRGVAHLEPVVVAQDKG